mmetsp:Transcript_23617/g.49199  ORF Transcript_23617/g.49199 Transcript_23617/m.49199 type:complete len:233 (+) Transcript_23617:2-700(+)
MNLRCCTALVAAIMSLGTTSAFQGALSHRHSTMENIVLDRRGCERRGQTRLKTKLQGTALPWIVGSIAGGCTGTPLVIKATGSWYREIELPLITPPDRIFAPVWTTLYGIIGYVGWNVHKKVGWNSTMSLYAFHYILNLLWAPLFFGLQRIRSAQVLNFILLSSLSSAMYLIARISPFSSALLIPYFAWLTFATFLNGAICRLNPTVKGYNEAMLQAGIMRLRSQAGSRVGL